jgi:hypothetical protein
VKITIEIDDELIAPAIQEHLETAKPVQEYIKSAMCFYLACKKIVAKGDAIGHGQPDNMRRYHTIINLSEY